VHRRADACRWTTCFLLTALPCRGLAASGRRRSRWSAPAITASSWLLRVLATRSRDERPGRKAARRYAPAGGEGRAVKDRPRSGHHLRSCARSARFIHHLSPLSSLPCRGCGLRFDAGARRRLIRSRAGLTASDWQWVLLARSGPPYSAPRHRWQAVGLRRGGVGQREAV
jgi:hypothetical protein